MARAFLRVFFDFEERTEMLSETERGRLLLGMLHYAHTGREPDLSGNERFLWPVFRGEIDREIASYETRVQNGAKGGRPAKSENRTEPDETEQNRKKPNKTENNRNAEEQEQDQEQDVKTDDDDDSRARARDEADVREVFLEEIGRRATPEEVRQICVAASLNGFSPGVAGMAAHLAAVNSARNPVQYAKKIMDEWRAEKLKTPEEIRNYQLEQDARMGKLVLPAWQIMGAVN